MFDLLDHCMAMLGFLFRLGIFHLKRQGKILGHQTLLCGILDLELDRSQELFSSFEYRRKFCHRASIDLQVRSSFLEVKELHLCS